MASATIAFSALRGAVSGNIACFLNHNVCAVTRSQGVLFGGIQGFPIQSSIIDLEIVLVKTQSLQKSTPYIL